MEGAPTRTPAVGAEAASPGSGGGCGGRATRTLAVDAKAVSPQPRRRMPNQRHLHSDGGCRGRVAWILAVGCGGRATWILAVGVEVVPPGLWRWVRRSCHLDSGGGCRTGATRTPAVAEAVSPGSGGGCGGRATRTLAVGAEAVPPGLWRWVPNRRHLHSGGGSRSLATRTPAADPKPRHSPRGRVRHSLSASRTRMDRSLGLVSPNRPTGRICAETVGGRNYAGFRGAAAARPAMVPGTRAAVSGSPGSPAPGRPASSGAACGGRGRACLA
jgi:hypothetical protein